MPARFADSLRDPTETGIDVLASLDRLIEFARVAHHVRVREVDHENVGLAFINAAQHFVSYFESRHLRLQIVSRELSATERAAAVRRDTPFQHRR